MEIYTNDLIDLVAKYASKEKQYRAEKKDYAVNDLLFDMQREMRLILYKRLSEAFKDLDKSCKEDNELIELDDLYTVIKEI